MARSADSNPFGPSLLKFLRALAKNNHKSWFEAHREDYEAEVREPALMFIRVMARHVQRISPHLTAKDKKVGGSLMRVHRDVRFSKNKAPYKTNLGIQFRHEAGKDVHAPGLYFHVEPGRVFLGCGMWRPDREALHAVRQAIADDPKGWKRVRDAKAFSAVWALGGESLKRAPRDFPVDHPMIEDLKRTDHIAFCEFPDRFAVEPGLVDKVAGHYRSAAKYLRWQARVLDLAF
jgi:uncharacterized protein (TIGR02453 family)